MTRLEPFYQNVQAHYDLADEFFALFLDPTWTYSCAYFQRDSMTLEEAQLAKIDLSLGKLGLEAGMTLLDIGCGWGTTALRAAERFGVNVIGLTLSRNQWHHASTRATAWNCGRGSSQGPPTVEFRLQGWEEFDERVDRIVSIGAFEHFRKARYPHFFAKCHRLLPPRGRFLLHTIVLSDTDTLRQKNIAIEHEHVMFAKFIGRTIFPGGQLCTPPELVHHARAAGFEIERIQSLQSHYARTLDCWATNLQARKDQAIARTSQQVYDDYMRYFTGCAHYFRSGHIDVMQFTLVA